MNSKTYKIDVCVPTWQSESVLRETLEYLQTSVNNSPFKVNRLIIIDNKSEDSTVDIAEDCSEKFGWPLKKKISSCSLPEARQWAIEIIETEWFLFLDDDVRISTDYLAKQAQVIAPLVGAVQGRKSPAEPRNPTNITKLVRGAGIHATPHTQSNTEWVQRRVYRGGTHATLIRHKAVDGVDIPSDLTVWEDEYLRRHVEDNGYLWCFNHQSHFVHKDQERHKIGYEEGYIEGKYRFTPFYRVVGNIIFACFTGRSPWGHLKRTAGWTVGLFNRLSGSERAENKSLEL